MTRSEDVWYEVPNPTVGSAQPGALVEDAPLVTDFAGVLWIPDPEQRHGWREFYVAKNKPKPGARPIGFKR